MDHWKIETWTAKDVELRLREAAETLARLPAGAGERPSAKWSHWPDIARTTADAFAGSLDPRGRYHSVRVDMRGTLGRTALANKVRSFAAAVDRMDAAVPWLYLIEDTERRMVVWLRVNGLTWRKIEDRLDVSERTLRTWYGQELQRIAAGLNSK